MSLTRVAFLAAAWCGCAGAEPRREPAPTASGEPPPITVDVAPIEVAPAATPPASTSSPDEPGAAETVLGDPSKAREQAPQAFLVRFETTAGEFEVECSRAWSPLGVDRFYNLVKVGFYDEAAFFRVIKTPQPFVVQFGIHANPAISKVWKDAKLAAEPRKQSNRRGTMSFAMAATPDTRTTQVFINLANNTQLDDMGFGPICVVRGSGMTVVDALFGDYGDEPSREQTKIQDEGRPFLKRRFPQLDVIKKARLVSSKS